MKNVRLLISSLCCVFGVAASSQAQVLIMRPFAGTGASSYGGDNGPATAAQLDNQYMINLDAGGNNLYIADNGNNRVRKIDLSTNIITTVAGTGTSGFSGDGGPATAAQLGAPGGGGLVGVIGICADGSGNVFVADASNQRIRKVDASGIITTIGGNGTAGFAGDGGPATAAQIRNPRGMWVDGPGNIYFTEGSSGGGGSTMRVRKIDVAGIITTVAGNGTTMPFLDNMAATAASLNNPRGLCVDAAGNIYIADFGNNRVRRVDGTTNIITTVAGNGTTTFGEGVAATATGLNQPLDVKMDGAGNLYIATLGHARIRKVDMTTGIITTVAGSGTAGNDAGNWSPATASNIRLASLSSVAVMANGNYFFISDRQGGGGTAGNRVKHVRPNSIPYFTGGTRQSFSVCEDQGPFDIGSFIAVTDSDQVQIETWSLGAWAPLHGSVTVAGTAAANGSSVTITGRTYTPTPGYVGTDSFIVNVSDGHNSAADTIVVTVNPLPVVSAITGTPEVCESATTVLASSPGGGTWTASNANATVVGGTVTGVTAGTVDISYTVTNSCGPRTVVQNVTVNPLPNAGTITGAASVCEAGVTTLADAAGGGTWSASNGNVTVDGLGNVTGVTMGTTTISYTVTNSCGTASATHAMTIDALPAAISGANNVCVSASIVLTDASAGGVWSASNSNATVTAGLVTGVTAGTVDISYTLTNACGVNAAVQPVTVNPLPDAGTIVGASNICISGTVTFTDTAPGGVWSASNSNATVDGSGNVTGVTAGTVVISYSVTNGCGTAVATFSVNVVSTPSAGTITGLSNVCPAATITLSNLTAGGVWSASNSNATVDASGNVTGVTAGTVNISYTVTASCGVASTFNTVIVDPLPNAGTITGSSNVCLAGTTTLTATVGGGAWSSGSTSIATVSGLGVVSGMMVGAATISYAVTNVCGTGYATHGMNVDPILTPSVTFSATPGFNTCPGTLVTYNAAPVNGGSSPVYEWRVNGFVLGAGASFNHIPVNGDRITVRMSSSAACISAAMVYDTMVVVVYPTLVPAVSISTGIVGDTVCVGTPVSYYPTPVNGGTTPAYTWYVNGVAAGSGSPFTFIPADNDVITTSMNSSYVCPSLASVMSNSITMTVDVTQTPAITITASPTSAVCIGSMVTFTSHPLYGGITPLFRWSRNGVYVATGSTFSYAPSNGDNIRCLLASSSSCRTIDTVFSNNIHMNVNSPQPISVTISQSSSVIGVGNSAVFTALVSTTSLTPTYQWYVNGTGVPGATNNTYTISGTAPGTKTVNCVAGTGDACYTTAASNILVLNVTPAGVNDLNGSANELRLAPNPNKGTFSMHMISGYNEPVHVVITNIIGKKVKEFSTLTNKDAEVVLNQPAGIYMLSATTEHGTHVAKVYVQ
ncbi:MAG: surface protein [Flavipsychrobacter sp.]|jgi:uncharacterized protein YjdB|nr:surface protein [Flavipsychrobacter sp.]